MARRKAPWYLKPIPTPTLTLQEFAGVFDLVMEVHEFDWEFSAHFDGVEVVDGAILCSASGRGDTPTAALKAYAKEISGKTLRLGGLMGYDVEAPYLVYRGDR